MLLAVAPIMMINACNNTTATSEKAGNAATTNEPAKKDSVVFQAIDTTKLAKGVVFYQCSMHADINSDKQGDCPTCGMKLDPKTKL